MVACRTERRAEREPMQEEVITMKGKGSCHHDITLKIPECESRTSKLIL
jgi:hypothetical protein